MLVNSMVILFNSTLSGNIGNKKYFFIKYCVISLLRTLSVGHIIVNCYPYARGQMANKWLLL
ncbi:unnamed protein product [Leptidea sinapis]|uniref:Uncharacterized protein n=1 Tax=Leptidea sinapis TaxID=189913 RepID=A0A5E4Q5V3_9NEOP|nr:unnamed protein product [Leptidea sinapis]